MIRPFVIRQKGGPFIMDRPDIIATLQGRSMERHFSQEILLELH